MEAFDRFVQERKEDLRRIARHTRGECAYEEVVNEAWLMAETISARQHVPIDFLAPAFQQLLLSHLYQHLVRYTDLNVRHAIRLDHAITDDTEHGAPHPLLNVLASDEDDDPLSFLIASEEKPAHPSPANEQHSLASAYLILLGHFGNRMRSVANHLLISTSYAYRCCAKACLVTACQHALLLAPPAAISALKPWRSQRMLRTPQQLEFDFDEELPFVIYAQAAHAPAS